MLQFFGETFGIEYTLPKMVLSEGTVMCAEYIVFDCLGHDVSAWEAHCHGELGSLNVQQARKFLSLM